MNEESIVLELLQRKHEIFLIIENLTEKMKGAPIEKLTRLFEQRGDALQRVTEIDCRLKELACEDEALKGALNNSSEPASLCGELAEVFKASLAVKAVANRVLKIEPEVQARVENERDKLFERLEVINSSGNSVAESYKRSVQTGFPQNPFGRKEKSI